MSNAVRDVAKQKTPKQLRMRCSPALLKLLRRRLSQNVTAELAERTRQGKLLRDLLKDYAVLPAGAAKYHDYWVFPAIVENPTEVIQALRLKGFDACDLPRSEAIAPPEGREDLRAHIAESMLTNLVVVPCYPGMSDGTLRRQAEIFLLRRKADGAANACDCSRIIRQAAPSSFSSAASHRVSA